MSATELGDLVATLMNDYHFDYLRIPPAKDDRPPCIRIEVRGPRGWEEAVVKTPDDLAKVAHLRLR